MFGLVNAYILLLLNDPMTNRLEEIAKIREERGAKIESIICEENERLVKVLTQEAEGVSFKEAVAFLDFDIHAYADRVNIKNPFIKGQQIEGNTRHYLIKFTITEEKFALLMKTLRYNDVELKTYTGKRVGIYYKKLCKEIEDEIQRIGDNLPF